jgi:hypothetical protein
MTFDAQSVVFWHLFYNRYSWYTSVDELPDDTLNGFQQMAISSPA